MTFPAGLPAAPCRPPQIARAARMSAISAFE